MLALPLFSGAALLKFENTNPARLFVLPSAYSVSAGLEYADALDSVLALYKTFLFPLASHTKSVILSWESSEEGLL